jgi:hypothetical protein
LSGFLEEPLRPVAGRLPASYCGQMITAEP